MNSRVDFTRTDAVYQLEALTYRMLRITSRNMETSKPQYLFSYHPAGGGLFYLAGTGKRTKNARNDTVKIDPSQASKLQQALLQAHQSRNDKIKVSKSPRLRLGRGKIERTQIMNTQDTILAITALSREISLAAMERIIPNKRCRYIIAEQLQASKMVRPYTKNQIKGYHLTTNGRRQGKSRTYTRTASISSNNHHIPSGQEPSLD